METEPPRELLAEIPLSGGRLTVSLHSRPTTSGRQSPRTRCLGRAGVSVVFIIMGWILATAVVLSLTGLLKRD